MSVTFRKRTHYIVISCGSLLFDKSTITYSFQIFLKLQKCKASSFPLIPIKRLLIKDFPLKSYILKKYGRNFVFLSVLQLNNNLQVRVQDLKSGGV